MEIKPERDGSAEPVIHVIVKDLERLDVPEGGVGKVSRDFH